MLVLPGSSAWTVPRRDAVLRAIQQSYPLAISIDAIWLHLVKCSSQDAEKTLSDIDSSERKALTRLLDYGDDVKLSETMDYFNSGMNVIYVLPRIGSISAWSSKATDIAGLCNLGDHIERLERGIAFVLTTEDNKRVSLSEIPVHLIHDRMTQTVSLTLPGEDAIFAHKPPRPLRTIPISSPESFANANKELGLALSDEEISYLISVYSSSSRDPTDAELFMFAQVNSEHCRHKIFNASWSVDDVPKTMSLFQMIRNTEKISGQDTISAYSDNAAVLKGHQAPRFGVSHKHANVYQAEVEDMPILIKVETHNHPTAVSPYPGAATGSGGEIRDEGAVGRGSKPKAGLAGFSVSNLLLPGCLQPWEEDFGKPSHIASSLDIMLEAPLGASAFNNEFGRPALAGYFRTFCERLPLGEIRGYHKPIMIAGGYGTVRPQFSRKSSITPGAKIAVLGGPGLLIGLGGGAASSLISGASTAELDFASVQRDNAEMQRRCQQVIDFCVAEGEDNPIESIHDVGAGGLSNALPELVHDSDLGGVFEIRDVLVSDSSMSPMEIWCNESQERYVLAISPDKIGMFERIAKRERCPFSIVGAATQEQELVVTDRLLGSDVIRLKMSSLFGKPPRMSRTDTRRSLGLIPFVLSKHLSSMPLSSLIANAAERVLHLPSVASKSFLITIGDRSITGLVTRDQMVGPYQIPVSDVAVTRSSYSFTTHTGESMAMGERTPLALISPAASARVAVGESLTNLAASFFGDIAKIKLSANWMCAASKPGEGAGLYDAVQALGEELCPALGVGIPVGKDSMSMSMRWIQDEKQREVTAPLSLIITAFAPVLDVRATWTPQLRTDLEEPTILVLIDLGNCRARLGGSALAQVFREVGDEAPDVDDLALLKSFIQATQLIRTKTEDMVLAYHDRSDGGLFTTVVEMAFAGRIGVELTLSRDQDPVATLFNEELGAVVQIREAHLETFKGVFQDAEVPSSCIHRIGRLLPEGDEAVRIVHGSELIFESTRRVLQQMWSDTSFKMQSLRDNPITAKEEYELISDNSHRGIYYDLTFTYSPLPAFDDRPKVAILREQGVNGQIEMAWAFSEAGFDAVDVHMSDILSGSTTLDQFRGVAACGGFSYGDVLGAGKGWAHSVLLNPTAREVFSRFFRRDDTFTLAVCNGCQFLSHLRSLIPGAERFPDFKPNKSERFEARVCMVQVADNEATRSSVFLSDMVGSKLPVPVAHGEGRVSFSSVLPSGNEEVLVAIRYIDSNGLPTNRYPLNPNGSPEGITGVQTPDGRVLALMPHPERATTLECNSWYPHSFRSEWEGTGPWFRLFQNARKWCNIEK